MKSILILAVFASVPAMAMTYGDGREEPIVRYLSWCDHDNVIGEDAQGQLYVRANCAAQGLECKATPPTYRHFGSTVTATCVEKK
jgi:hypothetical protein